MGSFCLRVVVADVTGNVSCKLQTETNLSEGRDQALERTFGMIHDAIRQSGLPNSVIKAWAWLIPESSIAEGAWNFRFPGPDK
ncbi:MAG: hypothetical protein ACRD3T_20535 [Terriglobia bacterium]